MNLLAKIKDKFKIAYWNNLKLANILIALLIVFIIKLILDYNFSTDSLNDLISANKKDIYVIVATISGTLLGFIITSISIIVVFTKSEKFDLLRATDHYDDLFNVFFSTIKFLALTTLVAVMGILFNYWNIIMFYIILWAVIVSSLLVWACIWVIEFIISIVKQ